MGNLSQVFISNALTALDGSQAQFGDLAGAAAADDVGIFTLGPGTAEYKQTALYATTVDTDTSNADDTTVGALTVANPLWLYHSFQVVQRALTGAVLQSPIIATSAVKRISHTPHVAWVGHKATCVDATFNSAGKMGKQNKVITVVSNSSAGSARVSIISNVLPKKTTTTPVPAPVKK